MSAGDGNTLYPVFLKLHELNLLVVGGGSTGLEKLTFILKNSPDANITMVAEIIDARIKKLAGQFESVKLQEKTFEADDLNKVNLLILATNDLVLDKKIKILATKRNILTNVADKPELCDFYLGSIVSKGDLKIAISTNGKSPTMAKRIREYLEDALPDSTDELLANLGEIRDKLTGGLKEKINALNKITSSFKNKDKVELNVNELPMNIDELNIRYKAMSPSDRIMSLFKEFDDVLYTSSFGTTAAYLLHLISSVKPEQEVFFLNTSYHFIETLKYKDSLVKQFNLNLTEVLPEQWKNEFTQKDKTWTKDQDLCCSINKVEPLDKLKEGKKIWISGLLGYQNKHRKDLPIFEKKGDLIKFYPIIDATEEEVETYYAVHRIPKHPLQKQGYESIGCAQCTVKGKGREGRWTNTSKTECGLHM